MITLEYLTKTYPGYQWRMITHMFPNNVCRIEGRLGDYQLGLEFGYESSEKFIKDSIADAVEELRAKYED